MNNYDRYLRDINPEMLEDIAKKKRLKTVIYDILTGIFFCALFVGFFLLILSSAIY